MNFKEVTAEDLFGKGVTGLPDTPGLSTTDMQAKFDELVKDVMVPKFNALVRELAVLSGVESVTKELENTETSIPTGSAVAKYIEEKGSGNATVEEMTWAEYEALSEEEKMDGTLRVITDRKAGVRFGNVDISGIGDGTVTGAISAINGNLSKLIKSTHVVLENVQITTSVAFGYVYGYSGFSKELPTKGNILCVGLADWSGGSDLFTISYDSWENRLYILSKTSQTVTQIRLYVVYTEE